MRVGERDLDQLRERLEGAIVRARTATCPQITPSATVGYIRTRPGEEIGAMIAFLASDRSGYTSGSVVTIDAGISARAAS